MSKLRRNKGLTLLQLLIVLSIASILILAGVPEFRDMIENHKLRAITEKFYSDLQLVRSETIKNQEDIYVNLNSDSNWCYGINNATPCDCKTANNCLLNGTEKVVNAADFQSIVMSIANIPDNSIRFNRAKGSTNVNNGLITFSINEKTVTIEVNLLGRIRICSNSIPGYKPC